MSLPAQAVERSTLPHRGHDRDQLVPLERGHHGETHAGVARRGFNDRPPGLEPALVLGALELSRGVLDLDGRADVADVELPV